MPIACLHSFELVAAWGGALLFQIDRSLFQREPVALRAHHMSFVDKTYTLP